MTLPGSNRRGRKPINPAVLYADIIQVLQTALGEGEARIRLASSSVATLQLQRMNRYRRILREQSVEGICPYDHWMFRISHDDPCAIEIVWRDRITPQNIQIETMDGRSLNEQFARAYRPVDPSGTPLGPDEYNRAMPGPMQDAVRGKPNPIFDPNPLDPNAPLDLEIDDNDSE